MQFIIAGCGKFGELAADRLSFGYPRDKIILVDNDPCKLSMPSQTGDIDKIAGDVVEYLSKKRDDLLRSDSWIIPTVPFHLLARVALGILTDLRLSRLPAFLDALLPNTFRVDDSTLCCSYSDFVCPDDCEEGPACTVTGEKRKPLYTVLQELDVFGSCVRTLVSRQLCPGIGGYQARDFFLCIDGMEEGSTIIGTSCRCHAVLTALTRQTILAAKIDDEIASLGLR